MKKIFIALLATLSFMLVGCDFNQPEPEQVIIIQHEIVEVPVIVKETEVIYVPEFHDTITISIFFTSEGDLAIISIGQGNVSYVMEIAYVDKLFAAPMFVPIQIEKQVDGLAEDWFFFEEYSGASADTFNFEVEDMDDWMYQVQLILEEDLDTLWQHFEMIYEKLYEDYYSPEV